MTEEVKYRVFYSKTVHSMYGSSAYTGFCIGFLCVVEDV